MNLLDFSRARYTLPNIPLPSGRPISKLASDHFFWSLRWKGYRDKWACEARGRSREQCGYSIVAGGVMELKWGLSRS